MCDNVQTVLTSHITIDARFGTHPSGRILRDASTRCSLYWFCELAMMACLLSFE